MPTEPTVINPYAVLKSIEDQYNYAIAIGVIDPAYYQQLDSQLAAQVDQWNQALQTPELAGGGPAAMEEQQRLKPILQNVIDQASQIRSNVQKSVQNAGLAQTGRAHDDFVSSQGGSDGLTRELYDLIKNQGLSVEDAVRVMAESGQYSVTELQRVAGQVGNPKFDPSAMTPPGEGDSETELPFGPGEGGGGGRRFEPVAQDLTSPQEEFQKSFAQFTRQLETTATPGKAPQIAALSERYQDLFNKYLGEIEERKTRGEEPENVFKEAFVNIGKSTDPQFDQSGDRMQLQTVRPGLSAFDFLMQNVDPEDVYQSTVFEQRPGRSTGGFRGYVRRL